MRFQKLDAYLETGIQALMPQARRLLELRQILATCLPKNLQRSCTIANYLQGKVVIFAENSAIAAKLKLLVPELQDRFVSRAIEVTGIDIQVQPKEALNTVEKFAELSPGAIDSLTELERQLPDSELKSAVSTLLERHRSKH
jgi:hypothetical protein